MDCSTGARTLATNSMLVERKRIAFGLALHTNSQLLVNPKVPTGRKQEASGPATHRDRSRGTAVCLRNHVICLQPERQEQAARGEHGTIQAP